MACRSPFRTSQRPPVERDSRVPGKGRSILVGTIVLVAGAALYGLSQYSYLLFHNLAELFSVVIAAGVFVVAWNTRSYNPESPLIYIGTGYLCIALLDVLHTISYQGMGVFPPDRFYANQMWIAARFIEATTLLVFLGIVKKRDRTADRLVAILLPLLTAAAIFTIFVVPIFPACFVAGRGQTPFKIISEYAICTELLAAYLLFRRDESSYDHSVARLMKGSILLMIVEELLFTTYTDNFGVTNVLGHLFKIASFYLMYKAVIETSLRKPYDTTFRQLVRHEHALENANRMKDRLLSIIGHDLRNPVGGIAEMSRLILTDETVLEQLSVREVMDHIYRSASQSLDLLNNLLYWARSQNGSLKMEPEEFAIAEIASSTVELFDSAIQNKSINVDLKVDSDRICADRNMVTTVLRNLFSNAVKFTHKGGTITVREYQSGDSIVVEVSDSGVGMTPVQKTRVLEGEAAMPTRGTEGEAGTGLGLAVTREFVRQHGGSIDIEDRPGGGTLFRLVLPASPAATDHSD